VEQDTRKRVIAAVRLLRWTGSTEREAAAWIGIAESTLGAWQRGWTRDRLEPRPRGRPLERVESEERQRIVDVIDYFGPQIGLPTVRTMFPSVARGELEDLLRHYRTAWTRDHRLLLHTLRWTRAGTAWAMDYADPPSPVDGIYRHILLVRDIGSRCNLLWLPVVQKNELAACAAFRSLVAEHGAPLVLKADNDGAFQGGTMESVTAACGTWILPSPPYMPRYNGSCEAGVGALKIYTHHEAARHDRPGEWNSDDLEAARLKANHTSRPNGWSGPSAEQVWNDRTPVTPHECEVFHDTVRRFCDEVRLERGLHDPSQLTRCERAAVRRQALTRALVKLGFLLVRRRRISPPIKSRFASRIS